MSPLTLVLGSLVGRLFPRGTRSFIPSSPEEDSSWPPIPDFPPDLFAIAAYLLDVAGAYHYGIENDDAENWSSRSVFFIERARTTHLADVGKRWSESPRIPPEAKDLWQRLGRFQSAPIYQEHRVDNPPPKWWPIALNLLVIADEACADVGYGATRQYAPASGQSPKPTWIANVVQARTTAILHELAEKDRRRRGSGHIPWFPQWPTICANVDPDVACVQPKSRTPDIGCTLRTFSHNLALLPPRGVVKANWQRPPEPLTDDDHSTLNLLLIPYPFTIAATWFAHEVRLRPEQVSASDSKGMKPWGWFELHQHWLNGSQSLPPRKRQKERRRRIGYLVEFTIKLIERATADVGTLHGIVFPEYALDWEAHEAIVEGIRSRFHDIEFLVSGSSHNCRGEVGNVALSTVFTRPNSDVSPEPIAITTSRAKHHRWRLDEGQISTYALASSLDPRTVWWEKAVLPKREIHINVFRASSTFATMICEDLARVDPCHVVLRSVGPSLVFVLLMDGPQLADRWASRYATALADDPGSSVLTLTSLGLLERANKTGRADGKRFVALWKEDTGKTVPIPCEKDTHGIVLTLSGHRTTEVTMDGRPNRDGRAWRFHGQQPVRVTPTNDKEREMVRIVTGMDV